LTAYLSDEERKLLEEYQKFKEGISYCIRTMQYDKVLDVCVERYGEEEAESSAIYELYCELHSRVKLLEKVANVARKHAVEDMKFYERAVFLQKKLKDCRWYLPVGRGSRTCHLDFFFQSTLYNMLCYPVYKLGIRRAKKMYSPKQMSFMRKWGLAYLPPWMVVEDETTVWKSRWHRSGGLTQYLGSDGSYSSHNYWGYEFTPWHKTKNHR